jgi:hypothetical protein
MKWVVTHDVETDLFSVISIEAYGCYLDGCVIHKTNHTIMNIRLFYNLSDAKQYCEELRTVNKIINQL